MKTSLLIGLGLIVGFWAFGTSLYAKSVRSSASKASATSTPPEQDPFLWLEEIHGDRAMNWVKAKNQSTLQALTTDPAYDATQKSIREIVLSQDRLPPVQLMQGKVYQFWQDEKNVRGLWRRALVQDYKTSDPKWETVIDLDDLARKESENWVWKENRCLPPDYKLCLITLSRGGKDASVIREFNTEKKEFVKDGFNIPEAKSSANWMDLNTILVNTDMGPGSLTSAGYPRWVMLWKRGTPLAQSKKIFEGQESDVSVYGSTWFRPEENVNIVLRFTSFFENEVWLSKPETPEDLKQVPISKDADLVGFYQDQLLFRLRADWTDGAGSLVAISINEFLLNNRLIVENVITPTPTQTIQNVFSTQNEVFAILLDQVASSIYSLKRSPNGQWKQTRLDYPEFGAFHWIASDDYDPSFLSQFSGFLIPPTIYEHASGSKTPNLIKSLPAKFNASDLVVEQNFVKREGNVKVPYFLIHKKDFVKNSAQPTLLYAYGGFEYSVTPTYLDVVGKAWLEKGGVYAVANIRGGGEYGPKWHQAAIKENRQLAYDDFTAVAKDLFRLKITSPAHLGISGASNGGLLMGVSFTQHPELYNAVFCQVPLTDMMRYTHLLAGSSWIGEFGDPADPQMKKVLLRYSPYQNLKKNEKYPKVFFTTSTEDDRVHPGHARKMAAKMESLGYPFFYYENVEGGHAGSANLEQTVQKLSMEFIYLTKQLF